MNNNLFQLILRDQYTRLPEVVRRFHETRLGQFNGKVTVKGANNFMASLLRKLGGFPQPVDGETSLKVRVIRAEIQERWQRQFGDKQFSSRFDRIHGLNLLREDFGMISYCYSLSVRGDHLHWQFESWAFMGIPMPEFLAPDVEARESVDANGRYQFSVTVEYPMIGVLLEYAGWLE